MRAWQRWANYCLWGIAVAWPLDVFQYIPFLGVSFTGFLSAVLALLLFLDVTAGGSLRTPFEILLPVALLAGLFAYLTFSSAYFVDRETVGGIFLFLATAHFARSRDAMLRWLRGSVLAGGFAAALTLIAPMLSSVLRVYDREPGSMFDVLRIVPTAYDLDTGATLTFSYSITGGAAILLFGFAIAVHSISGKGASWVWRVVGGICALLMGTAFVKLGVELMPFLERYSAPLYVSMPWPHVLGLVAALWLVARVVAKVEVDRREIGGADGHWLWLAGGGIGLLYAVFAPIEPRLYHAYLMGLMCGYVLPDRHIEPRVPHQWAPAFIVPLLAVVNVLHVFPGHDADPRNYETDLRDDFESGAYDRLLDRLAYIESEAPGELRTHLWRARYYLEERYPDAAVYEFRLARHDLPGNQLLGGVTRTEERDFLVRVRDLDTGLPPERVTFAYERLLCDLGYTETAVQSMELRKPRGIPEPGIVETGPIVDALAHYVAGGRDEIKEAFSEWTAGELLGLLATHAPTVLEAPTDAPAKLFPFAVATWRDGHRYFSVAYDSPVDSKFHKYPARGARPPAALEATRIVATIERRDGAWRLILETRDGGPESLLALFHLQGGAEGGTGVPWTRPYEDLPAFPGPSLHVWLPSPVYGEFIEFETDP